MKAFSVLLCVCSAISVFGQPLDNLNNVRNVRQTSQPHQRLRNYPVQQLYRTQIIDYPGGAPTNGHMIPNVDYQFAPAIYQPQPNHHAQPIHHAQPVQPVFTTTTTTTTTTTPTPEEIIAPIPSIRAPIQPPSDHRFGLRRQQYTTIAPRFQGQDIIENEPIELAVPHKETEDERLLREEQAKNAHYTFDSSIDDKINDHSISRQETRNGLALKGMYSYSDGFYKRTIHYEADENGYRVVKEEIEPIGDGPQFNPNGTADVTTNLHNNNLSYSITAQDFVRDTRNKTVTERNLE